MTRYDKIVSNMNFSFFRNKNRRAKKIIADYKQELLVKHGREQFMVLVKKGLSVPIALL